MVRVEEMGCDQGFKAGRSYYQSGLSCKYATLDDTMFRMTGTSRSSLTQEFVRSAHIGLVEHAQCSPVRGSSMAFH